MNCKKTMILTLALAFAMSLTGCGNKSDRNAESISNTNAASSPGNKLSGSILAAGSTALQPLVEQVGKKFMDANPGVSVQVQGGGSGTGLTQAAGGQVQIGNSDVFASEKMKDAAAAKSLIDHQVAVVAIAAVTHPDAGVTNLSRQQLVDIFTGKITNWKELNGKDETIVIVNRPSSSGTRAAFEKFALGTKTEDLKNSIQQDSSGTVKKIIAETPGAIGYLALSYLDNKVKTLKYEGVDATLDNVMTGAYPVWAYEHMYTKGEPNAETKALLDYFMTDEIQNGDVVKMGYIPASKMQVKRDESGKVTK